MRRANLWKYALKCFCSVWLLIIAMTACASVKLQLRDGRPIVDGVYVNGNGPFRFLLDTGSNLNLIDARLAKKIGLTTTTQVELASAAGKTAAAESDGNEIALDTAKVSGQRLLISTLDAIHNSSPDVQGVLGTWFLAQFDFTLDLLARQLIFGALPPLKGTRIDFHMVNARPVISTSLGNLALDSGQSRLVLFGVQSDDVASGYQLRTVAGTEFVGKASRALAIAGRRIWNGDAVAILTRPEAGVDGLLPINAFNFIYICNSASYMVLR